MDRSIPNRMTALGFVVGFLGMFLLWIVFTDSLDPQELIAGAVVSALVAVMTAGMMPNVSPKVFSPVRWAVAIAYVGYLMVAIFVANIDMARIVARPTLRIKPGIVRARTKLKSPLGRLILANSITLTPGTLSVDIEGDELFVHWVNVEAENIDEATAKIVTGFERYLGVIFG